jgi:hypothetical protein
VFNVEQIRLSLAAIHSYALWPTIGQGGVCGTIQTGHVRLLSTRLYPLRPTGRLERLVVQCRTNQTGHVRLLSTRLYALRSTIRLERLVLCGTNHTGHVRLLSTRLYALRPTNRLETVERITLVIYGCYLTTSWHMHTVTDNLIREGDIPARTNQTDGPGWAAHHSHVRTAAYNTIGEVRSSKMEQI